MRRIKVKILRNFFNWLKKLLHPQPKKRNIMLESCFYDSEKADKDFEEYKKRTGLSTMEIACGIKPKKK